jgi:hypothetical protein
MLSQRPSIAFRLLALGGDLLGAVRGGKHYHCSPQACAGGGFRSHGQALECEFSHRSLRTGFDFCDGRVHCHRVGEALRPNQGSGVGRRSTALTLPSARGSSVPNESNSYPSCRKQPPGRSRSMSFAAGPRFRSSDRPNENELSYRWRQRAFSCPFYFLISLL